MARHAEEWSARAERLGCVALAAGALIFAGGCGYPRSVTHTYVTDQRFAPYPASHPVEILSDEPTRPFIRVANISVRMKVEGFSSLSGRSEHGMEALRKRAREIGADGVYLPPDGVMDIPDRAHTLLIQGMAFRWRDGGGGVQGGGAPPGGLGPTKGPP
jgi:hypothetical protein